PQKGRYRQFHQLGVEAFGAKGPAIDVEQILMVRRIFDALGILPLKLEINTLGNAQERGLHREALIAHFEAHRDALDADAQRRLYTNPLRILDTKNPDMRDVVESAPKLLDYLGDESRAFFEELTRYLKAADVEFEVNPRLVRGLDYYNHTVYEWITDKLGAQATVCGGGRYDPLVEMLGGKPTPGVGFAIGVERVLEVMRATGFVDTEPETDLYVLHMGAPTLSWALVVAESLRDMGYRVMLHPVDASFKSQMRRADASKARFAIICGESETENAQVTIKRLFGEAGDRFMEQETVPFTEALDFFLKQ
ncbi:MAG TPA: histidine--tRNA ligase, partial [Sutterella sp.]|nr:histidine--tRNA ligase [Sutterella sp.]